MLSFEVNTAWLLEIAKLQDVGNFSKQKRSLNLSKDL